MQGQGHQAIATEASDEAKDGGDNYCLHGWQTRASTKGKSPSGILNPADLSLGPVYYLMGYPQPMSISLPPLPVHNEP